MEDVLAVLTGVVADGATLLLVTHRLEEVERICDAVAVMRDGRIVLHEDLDTLRSEWRVVDVAGHPAPDRIRTWEEVEEVMPNGEHVRLHVRRGADAVVARI